MGPTCPKEPLRGQSGELYRTKWKSVDKIASLRKERKCFRCERRGCISRNCPLLPAINTKKFVGLPPIHPNVCVYDGEDVSVNGDLRDAEGKTCEDSIGIKLDYTFKHPDSSKKRCQVNATFMANHELEMNTPPFLVNVLLNDLVMVQALVDNGCLCSGIIDDALANRLNLPRTNISPRALQTVENSNINVRSLR
ncbi:hypothetical protein K3495_g13237 [Podosphaera aphanis]|nr:hypothetical protein K3495_g13237 [Podosphaera aphanis]